MNTPNPALVAAAPAFDAALAAVETFLSTTFTGDPLQIPARAIAAEAILIGTVELQFPGLLVAEQGVVGATLGQGVANLRARLKAAVTPDAAPAA